MASYSQQQKTRREERSRIVDIVQKKSSASSQYESIQETCIEVAMEVARGGEGCLLVVGDTDSFNTHFPNFFEKSKSTIFEEGMDKVLVKLAEIDGAIVVDSKGKIKAYGARITRQSTHRGSGTRHAAAKGVSEEKGIVSILASEEDKMVKIFKDGNQLVEINPFTKGVDSHVSKIVRFVNSPEGALATGAAVAIPFLGIPGVIVFAGSYYVARNLLKFAGKQKA
ncbi:MAG: DNA integrity scanning protein DisA nucleotide-binding domain protein [Candidatus Diapherotrites archaeon]